MQAENRQNQSGIKPSDTVLGAFVFSLMLFWMILVLYTVHPVLPPNPIQLPLEDHSPMVSLLPQGWGFFTRDPRSADMTAFLRTTDGWRVAANSKPLWPRLFEFSRSRKMTNVEVGMVLYEIPDPKWQPCEEISSACLDRATGSGQINNPLAHSSLCGDVGVVRQAPLPWAWSATPDETVMPSEVLRVQVACHD